MPTRDQIWFGAELSARYHRRRASFLERSSAIMSTSILIGGAGAFASLFGESTAIAKVATLLVALVGVIQIVFQVDRCAAEHRRWLHEWSRILLEVKRDADPTTDQINQWEERAADIEQECVGELRALQVDCWNRAATRLNYEFKPTPIPKWQRPLIQIFSFEAWYADPNPS